MKNSMIFKTTVTVYHKTKFQFYLKLAVLFAEPKIKDQKFTTIFLVINGLKVL